MSPGWIQHGKSMRELGFVYMLIYQKHSEIPTEIRTEGMIGNNIIRTDCHMIRIFCTSMGQTIDFMEIALG